MEEKYPLINDILYVKGPTPRAGTVKSKKWEVGQTIWIKFLRESNHPDYKDNNDSKDKRVPYSELEAEAKAAISEWAQRVNLNFRYLASNSSTNADINIGFRHSKDSNPNGSHSYIGTACKGKTVSINFGWRSERTYRHEFGHALGLYHEHQLPNHDIEWNKDYIYNYYAKTDGWDKATVDSNVFSVLSTSSCIYSEPDTKSIMCYYIPKEFIKSGDVSSFPNNTRLSDIDKKFISYMYPDYVLKTGAELNKLMKNSSDIKTTNRTITKIIYGLKNNYQTVVKNGTRRGSADAGNSTRTGVYIYNNAAYILVDSVKTYIPNCAEMFRGFESVETIDIRELNTIACTSMEDMFLCCKKLKSIDLSKLNTGQVTDMGGMFWDCFALSTLDISTFYTKNCQSMFSMFGECTGLVSVVLPTEMRSDNMKSLYQMFLFCSSLKSLQFPKSFTIENATITNNMFRGCRSLTSLDVSHFNTSKVQNMACMFHDCSSLENLDIRNFNSSNAKTLGWMFNGCKKLTSLQHNLSTKNATELDCMFKDCSSLSSIYVGGFDTSKVTTMKEMFMNCSKITSLNIRSFNMSKVTNMESLFSGCKKLNSLTVSKTFHPKQAAQTTDIQSGMYKDCPMKIVIS